MNVKLFFITACLPLYIQSADKNPLLRDVYWHTGAPVPTLPSLPSFFIKQDNYEDQSDLALLDQKPMTSESPKPTPKKINPKIHTCPLHGCTASYGSSTFFYWHLQNYHTQEERRHIAYICFKHKYATHQDATKRAHIRKHHKNLSKKAAAVAPATEKPHDQSDDSFEILG